MRTQKLFFASAAGALFLSITSFAPSGAPERTLASLGGGGDALAQETFEFARRAPLRDIGMSDSNIRKYFAAVKKSRFSVVTSQQKPVLFRHSRDLGFVVADNVITKRAADGTFNTYVRRDAKERFKQLLREPAFKGYLRDERVETASITESDVLAAATVYTYQEAIHGNSDMAFIGTLKRRVAQRWAAETARSGQSTASAAQAQARAGAAN